MEVQIIATKSCSHWPNLVRELNDLGIGHTVIHVEDEPDLCQQLSIRHSPNLVVDGTVIFRYQPSQSELRELFN